MTNEELRAENELLRLKWSRQREHYEKLLAQKDAYWESLFRERVGEREASEVLERQLNQSRELVQELEAELEQCQQRLAGIEIDDDGQQRRPRYE